MSNRMATVEPHESQSKRAITQVLHDDASLQNHIIGVLAPPAIPRAAPL